MRIKGIQWALSAAVLAMSASAFAAPPTPAMPVSYTHLTLPTSDLV